MIKLFFSIACFFIPVLAFSDTPISFAPPPSDYSVVFLGNIFGIVDGVLHGSGSQIMGAIFEVFNAAVMALGGMIITYTMLISTMNTAHEGEMLGKKWNSIWVPVRATAGFALLIPKASGYCLLQIFVMWVVVQGVGAADKVWGAALNYLNRGGVIIQAQTDPTPSLLGQGGSTSITKGAMSIFSGQVCMFAVKRILENKLAEYKAKESTVCSSNPMPPPGAVPSDLALFCSRDDVPDFVQSVDVVGSQRDTLESAFQDITQAMDGGYKVIPSPPSVPMPNFDPTAEPLYSKFNGTCGSISWKWISQDQLKTLKDAKHSTSDIKTVMQSRAIAIAQMYSDLMPTAELIVSNDTFISPKKNAQDSSAPKTAGSVLAGLSDSTSPTTASPQQAVIPFGVPLSSQTGKPCSDSSDQSCTMWGAEGGDGGGVLLSGTELQSAVMDYMGIMRPSLTLIAQGVGNQAVQASKEFIQTAKSSGWLMAGSYFFNLVALNNVNTASSSGITDSDSGLDKSSFDLTSLSCGSSPGVWCNLIQSQETPIKNIQSLFQGTTQKSQPPTDAVTRPVINEIIVPTTPTAQAVSPGPNSVFGYLQNALIIKLPGEPGQAPMTFDTALNVNFESQNFLLPPADFSCGGIKIIFFRICLGAMIGNLLYNEILLHVMNYFVAYILSMVQQLLMSFVTIPIQGFAAIFKGAVSILSVPGINPIIALANMGTYYINFVGGLWLTLLAISIGVSLGPTILLLPALIGLGMPMVMAWCTIMLGVGFITAYYVPIVPYMIFTFGSIAWFIAVIEAMVAAPIVALGVVHPEGHDAFGKGEAAIMILMNVFLRPSMMIIGYISAISLSYVGVWILNAGFDNAIGFVQGKSLFGTGGQDNRYFQSTQAGRGLADAFEGMGSGIKAAGRAAQDLQGQQVTNLTRDNSAVVAARSEFNQAGSDFASAREGLSSVKQTISTPGAGAIQGGYVGWAGIFAYFFSILIYTMIYMYIVEQAFTLISVLPDKVLRWIGGQAESAGAEAARVGEKLQGKIEAAGEKSGSAMIKTGQSAVGEFGKVKGGGKIDGHGDDKPPAKS